MAQYNIAKNPEVEIECPYDKSHMIRVKRFPYHLLKCRKNHATGEFRQCPFNARHQIPPPEYRYHIATCGDKARIEQDIIFQQNRDNTDGTYFKGNTDVPSYHDWRPPTSNEDWEREALSVPRIGVDPKLLDDKSKPRIKDIAGMTPAQKRRLKAKLKRRNDRQIAGLPMEDSGDEDKALNVKTVQSEPAVSKEPTLNGLRLPREAPRVLSMAGVGRGIGRGVGVFSQSPVAGGLQTQHSSIPPSGSYPNQSAAKLLADMTTGNARPNGVSQGIGRGILQGLTGPAFVTPVMSVSGNNGPDQLSQETNNNELDAESRKRKCRQLQKKLRQIEELESMPSSELNADQRNKVALKDILLQQLEDLEIE